MSKEIEKMLDDTGKALNDTGKALTAAGQNLRTSSSKALNELAAKADAAMSPMKQAANEQSKKAAEELDKTMDKLVGSPKAKALAAKEKTAADEVYAREMGKLLVEWQAVNGNAESRSGNYVGVIILTTCLTALSVLVAIVKLPEISMPGF